MNVLEVNDEDTISVSTICKNKKSQTSREKPKKETIIVLGKETKSNDAKNKSDAGISPDVESKIRTDVDIVDAKIESSPDDGLLFYNFYIILQTLIDQRDPEAVDTEGKTLPSLIYVACENTPEWNHNFKA
ncbi:Cellulose synthase-like protein E6 [Artemisia annua]|uniref:Cellulose synthase-like protein E6 n=1 Tax=Artemisia annua TaxID=35608 RepID=A0A2U1KK82_ARTAN|nr:Cellulose synthase-like protein E6 [Artemisia annua]